MSLEFIQAAVMTAKYKSTGLQMKIAKFVLNLSSFEKITF